MIINECNEPSRARDGPYTCMEEVVNESVSPVIWFKAPESIIHDLVPEFPIVKAMLVVLYIGAKNLFDLFFSERI